MKFLRRDSRRSLGEAVADQIDVGELLQLARNKSADARTQLADIVGDLFFDTGTALTDRERAIMGDILRKLIHDVEMTVRKTLAERLAREPEAPHDLIIALANDDIEVAYPVLVESVVLQDVDLIEIVQHRALSHQMAIALRKGLAEDVCDALVETRQKDVIKTMLENDGARISAATMEFLVEESQHIDAYQNPLLHRSELTPDLARRMYWWVSAALREYIAERFDIHGTALDQTVEDAVLDVLTAEQENGRQRKSEQLAEALQSESRITPRLMVDTLRQGEVTLFVDLFAKHTGLRTSLVRRFVFEPGGEGLAIACRASGVDKADFASLFLLSRSARPGDKVVDPKELASTIEFFDRIKPDTAKKVVERWHLDPDFLYALKQVEEGRRKGGA